MLQLKIKLILYFLFLLALIIPEFGLGDKGNVACVAGGIV